MPTFDHDIRPLFRERDRESMKSRFDLWSYDDVHANRAADPTCAAARENALRRGVAPRAGRYSATLGRHRHGALTAS